MKKVILAYSGGLDTSLCIHWLRYTKGYEVVTFSANLGQKARMEEVVERALSIGAATVHIGELKDRFVTEFVLPALKANAQYRANSLLAAALSRPIIAYEMTKIALDEGAYILAHGGTPLGNDQFRFETVFSSLEPRLKCIAPLREWDMNTREEEIEYARKNNIPITATKESPYSIDQNIWGTTMECGDIAKAWEETPDRIYLVTKNPADAPNEPAYVKVAFEEGIPTVIDGKHLSPVKIIEQLNALGGAHGVGRGEAVEDRIIGVKAMKIFEAPAAEILFRAHRALEDIALPRNLIMIKQELSREYSEMIYQGLWYTDLREAMDAFFNHSQRYVSGTVTLKLLKGACSVVARESKWSLYDSDVISCSRKDAQFNRKAAEGFLEIRKLEVAEEAARRKQKR
jgi:argininosuccinate synthase